MNIGIEEVQQVAIILPCPFCSCRVIEPTGSGRAMCTDCGAVGPINPAMWNQRAKLAFNIVWEEASPILRPSAPNEIKVECTFGNIHSMMKVDLEALRIYPKLREIVEYRLKLNCLMIYGDITATP